MLTASQVGIELHGSLSVTCRDVYQKKVEKLCTLLVSVIRMEYLINLEKGMI